ncbi:MAG TPA: hypothetical protein PKA20_13625 [Burkholderiaceae bacterium]|nr:hypothetical protein [Burkholderiaceae bacterium]
MNQVVNLGVTGLVSLIVGGVGGHVYANSVHATKVADLAGQIATLQKKVDEYGSAVRLEVPSDGEALAAIRKLMFFGGVKKVAIDQCQKDAASPGVICSLTITDKHDLVLPKVLRFVKIDDVWASQN